MIISQVLPDSNLLLLEVCKSAWPFCAPLQPIMVCSQTALYGSSVLLTQAVSAVSRRFGFRISMAIGTLGVALGQVFAGLSKEIWQLFLAQGVLFGSSMGFVFVPALPILGQWFHRRRCVTQVHPTFQGQWTDSAINLQSCCIWLRYWREWPWRSYFLHHHQTSHRKHLNSLGLHHQVRFFPLRARWCG